MAPTSLIVGDIAVKAQVQGLMTSHDNYGKVETAFSLKVDTPYKPHLNAHLAIQFPLLMNLSLISWEHLHTSWAELLHTKGEMAQ